MKIKMEDFKPYYECEVETWCSFRKCMVKLTLRNVKPFKGEIVKGKPIHCNFEGECKHTEQDRCYLKAIAIETRRGIG